jgi:hypothetical protein
MGAGCCDPPLPLADEMRSTIGLLTSDDIGVLPNLWRSWFQAAICSGDACMLVS